MTAKERYDNWAKDNLIPRTRKTKGATGEAPKFDRRAAIRQHLTIKPVNPETIDPALREGVAASVPYLLKTGDLTATEAHDAAAIAESLRNLCAHTSMSLMGKIMRSGFEYKSLIN